MAAEKTYKKTIGATTNASGAGGSIGGAISIIIAFIFSQSGIVLPPEVIAAMTMIITVIGQYIGGYLSPSKKQEVEEVAQEVVGTVIAHNNVNNTIPVPGEVSTATPNAVAGGSGTPEREILPDVPDEPVTKSTASSVAVKGESPATSIADKMTIQN